MIDAIIYSRAAAGHRWLSARERQLDERQVQELANILHLAKRIGNWCPWDLVSLTPRRSCNAVEAMFGAEHVSLRAESAVPAAIWCACVPSSVQVGLSGFEIEHWRGDQLIERRAIELDLSDAWRSRMFGHPARVLLSRFLRLETGIARSVLGMPLSDGRRERVYMGPLAR